MTAPKDPYAAITLLDPPDPQSGEISPWAGDVAAAIDTYTEIDVEGTGLTILVRGKTVRGLNRIGEDADGHQIRMFYRSRFVPMTGHLAPLSHDIVDGTHVIELLESDFQCRGTTEVA